MSLIYPDMDGSQHCRLEDVRLFFPGPNERGNAKKAKRVCAGCPFKTPCLQYALIYDLHGVWGGTTQKERRAYQRARKMQPIPVTVPNALGKRPTT